MTPRERLRATLARRPVDRLFRYEHGPWPTTRQRWESEGLPQKAELTAFFGFDPFPRLPVASGYTGSPFFPPFEREVLEEDGPLRVIRDHDGVVKKFFIEHADTSMPGWTC